jgi:DMSO reductase anchor subunit
MAADDLHGLWAMCCRWVYRTRFGTAKGNLNAEQQQRLVLSMFGLWVLMGIGFLASTLHLGSPLRAFNSLNRVGASSLSNEIASGAIFFALLAV